MTKELARFDCADKKVRRGDDGGRATASSSSGNAGMPFVDGVVPESIRSKSAHDVSEGKGMSSNELSIARLYLQEVLSGAEEGTMQEMSS